MIPGVLLGIPAGYAAAKALAPQINVWIDQFTISTVAILAGVGMGLGVPLLAAAVPVYWGTRVSILEALTDLGLSTRFGTGPLARLLKALPLPVTIRQAFANVFQKKGRLALTVLTLTLASGAFMGVMAVFLALEQVIGDMFDTYNYELVILPERDQDVEAITRIAGAVDGVAAVYPSYAWDTHVPPSPTLTDDEAHLWVVGYDPATDAFKLHLEQGTAWQGDPAREGIVLTAPKARVLGKTVGDPITLMYQDQQLDTQVIGIDSNPEEDGYMAWEPLYRLTHPAGAVPVPSALLVQLKNRDASPAEVDQVLGAVREDLLRNGISAGFFNQVAEQEDTSTMILAMGVIFNLASLVMALVAAIGLLTMLSISVFERQREIGVMRSVGAGSGTVAAQFLVEGLVVGVIGWLIGILLSLGVSAAFKEVVPWEAFVFHYPPAIILVGLAGTLILVALASLWPALAAARKQVSDILRYQ